MATYYRWRKSTVKYTDIEQTANEFTLGPFKGSSYHHMVSRSNGNTYSTDGIYYILNNEYNTEVYESGSVFLTDSTYFQYVVTPPVASQSNILYKASAGGGRIYNDNGNIIYFAGQGHEGTKYTRVASAGTSQGYVYSTSSSAYPNGGVQDGYYYDQRTTVTSPTEPTGLTYPNPITTPTITVSWDAATSNTDYPVDHYRLSWGFDSGQWKGDVEVPAGTTSYQFSIPAGTTQLKFGVFAYDTNGQYTRSAVGPLVPVYLAPTLTVPQMVMQGQQATVNWTAIDGATSYTLERKSSADGDWTQVYSGADLSYTETVGTWTSLQYRVQAVFDGTPGGWATSGDLQIVSASALVISGQDGDLGTLTNDVPYTISSDQTSPTIDVTVEVNGGEYASFQATSGKTYKVGVLDLPTGTGSIVITASAEVSDSPVTVTRTWTYSKTSQTFSNSGSTATITREDKVVYPKTLSEAVRTSMTPWGGNMSTALNLLKNATLFNRTKQAKYSEVMVSMANVTEGQIVNIPRGGIIVPHYVGKLEYESGLNGAGRRLLVPVECYDNRAWDAGSVNTWTDSDLLEWENGDYKALFPTEIQTAMGTTTYYFTPGNGNNTVTTRSDAVFSLSATELGLSQTWFNVEGSALPIVNMLKIAYLNGNANTQWTRTPNTSAVTHAIFLNTSGSVGNGVCNYSAGARPCFTLPSTFSGTYYVDQNGGIHDAQEYEEAGTWSDVWGNAIAIPAVKIETGSYVGTGASGSSNPNTLTFGFEPKLLMVAANNKGLDFNLYSSDIAWSASFIWFSGVTGMTMWNNPGVANLNISVQGNTISWYSTNATAQCNAIMTTYAYLAIG